MPITHMENLSVIFSPVRGIYPLFYLIPVRTNVNILALIKKMKFNYNYLFTEKYLHQIDEPSKKHVLKNIFKYSATQTI